MLIIFSNPLQSQQYTRLVVSTKSTGVKATPLAPDYGSLLQTIMGEINLRKQTKCLSATNTEISNKILQERRKLGTIQNRPINFSSDAVEYLLGVDYKNCKVIALLRNDRPALWSRSTIIFRIRLLPIIKLSHQLEI